MRRTRYAWLVSAADSVFTLALIALTGGLYSPVVAVLALAVIASAARLVIRRNIAARSAVRAAAYTTLVLTLSVPRT